ncbi:Stationary phase gene 1 protein [Nakaseomyces bracarensis]|uniref:Stationary phase gene 1 protein n=1 Tax=Nakaseomyces bracarensis TaxID=273131 RepID=A0ABR4NR08_9SACH
MQINPRVYSEAQKAAKQPQFKYLLTALICAAMVPTVYRRGVTLPHYNKSILDQVEENITNEPVKEEKPRRKHLTFEAMWKDAKNYDLDEELTYQVFSSIV